MLGGMLYISSASSILLFNILYAFTFIKIMYYECWNKQFELNWKQTIYIFKCRYVRLILSWNFWSWLDLINSLLSILLVEICTQNYFLTPFWKILLIHWVSNLTWDWAPPKIWRRPLVILLLSTCPYKLLRYCGDHVTHSPFDLKFTDLVAHSFCWSYFTRYLCIYNGISLQGVYVVVFWLKEMLI